MNRTKTPFMQWIDRQLDRDPLFRRHVEETLNKMRLDQDLATLRAARRLSQSRLASMLGVSQPAIAKIESGKVKNLQLRTLVRLATALGGRVKIEIVKGRPRATAKAVRPSRLAG